MLYFVLKYLKIYTKKNLNIQILPIKKTLKYLIKNILSLS